MHKYYGNCVCWPGKINELCEMIDNAQQITRKTFIKNVDKKDRIFLEQNLGYTQQRKKGMVIADDYYVSYFKSKLKKTGVYFLAHSCIEYVFIKGENHV